MGKSNPLKTKAPQPHNLEVVALNKKNEKTALLIQSDRVEEAAWLKEHMFGGRILRASGLKQKSRKGNEKSAVPAVPFGLADTKPV